MKIIDVTQGSYEWLLARRGIPTASEFDCILTAKTMKYSAAAKAYIHQLIADLADPYYGQVEDFVSAAMKNGMQMEPSARKWYEFDRDCKVEQVGFITTDDGRMGYSPDSLIGEDGLLELKCPELKTHVGYLLDPTKMVDAYRHQCHGGLIVTGRKWIDLASYSEALPPVVVRVEPDEYTDALKEALVTFWDEYQDALAKIKAMGWTPAPMQPKPEEGPSSPQAAALCV